MRGERRPRLAAKSTTPRQGFRLATAVIVWLAACLAPPTLVAAADWGTVPEMQEPPGIVVVAEELRQALTASAEGVAATARLEAVVTADWTTLQAIDWLGLSRYQLEATAGWVLPDLPEPLVSRVLGRDAAGRLHVETRGPRLPARFEIVHRHVYFFATYDPLTGEIANLLVTLRGWIEE